MPDTALMQFLLYIALYESKCILVGVALRPQVKAEIVCQNKFYKYHAPTKRMGNGDIPYE